VGLVSSYVVEKMSNLTVVVCSANREHLLKDFLNHWVGRKNPAKLILVENTKEDDIYRRFSEEYREHKEIVFVRSSPPGLSRARNVGLSYITTRYVAFTDDDCIPSDDWELEIEKVFAEQACAAVFGAISPIWPMYFDSAVLSNMQKDSLAIFDLGSKTRALQSFEFGVGANMSFDMSLIQDLRFDEKLGRIGSNLLSSEEWDFQNEMSRRSLLRYYSGKAQVFHKIEEQRLNPSWFISRFAWQGISDATSSSEELRNFHKFDFSKKNFDSESLFRDSWDDLDNRISYIRSFIYLALSGTTKNYSREKLDNAYFPPLPESAKKLIIEFEFGHSFIPRLLAREDAYIWWIPKQPYDMTSRYFETFSQSVFASLVEYPSVKELIFTSIESLLFNELFIQLTNLLQSGSWKIKCILHRIPAHQDELANLRKLSSRATIFVPSKLIQENLETLGIQTSHIPVTGTIWKTVYPRKVVQKSQKTIFGVFGELRDPTLVNQIAQLFEHSKNVSERFEIRIVGGCKDKKIYEKVTSLKRKFPHLLDISSLTKTIGQERFEGIHPNVYSEKMLECDYILKIQMREKMVASAVVEDALSLGVPVIALENTEAANQIRDVSPNLIIESLDQILSDKILEETFLVDSEILKIHALQHRNLLISAIHDE
jgi:glucosyl-dolichyl phosphate glucuronosyltransferase